MMARFDGASSSFRLFHHVADFEEAAVESVGGLGVEDAVGRNHFAFDDLRGDHGALLLVEDIHHLFEAGTGGVDDVVGQQDGEGLVADEFARHEHGVAQAERFFLADVGDVHHVGNVADDFEQVGLAALLEHFFEFVADVEVVFDGLLAAAGDDEDLVAAARPWLLRRRIE